MDVVHPSHITGMQGVFLPRVEPYIHAISPAYRVKSTDAVCYTSSFYKTSCTVLQDFGALTTCSSQKLGCRTLIKEAQLLTVTEHR
jgi:hypothetical protein